VFILNTYKFPDVEAVTRWALDGAQDPDAKRFWGDRIYSMKNLRDHLFQFKDNEVPALISQFAVFTRRNAKQTTTNQTPLYKNEQYSVAARRPTNEFLK